MCVVTEETRVGLSQPSYEKAIQLSTLDQHAVRIYSSFVLVFETEPCADPEDILVHLKTGLGGALTEFPEFAATVVPKAGSSRNELELQVGPESGALFRAVDHSSGLSDSDECHDGLRGVTYEQLESNNFPLTHLPKDLFFTQHAKPDDDSPDGIPVLLVQANIIDGGLLVGVAWHHSVCDARGMNTLVNAWAKATNASCTYGSIDEVDVAAEEDESEARLKLSYGTTGATIRDFTDYVDDASIRSPGPNSLHLLDRTYHTPANSEISMWYFAQESLQSLVSSVNGSSKSNEQQFTQVEALSALLWKHVSLARQIDVSFPGGSSLFTTRIDFRRRLSPPLPHEYIGNVNQPIPRSRVSIDDLCAPSSGQTLAGLAQRVRLAVAELDDKSVRKLIGYVDTLPSVTDLALEFDTCPGPDLAITDLSGLDVMQKDWGQLLGKVAHIRGFVRYRGFLAFLPADTKGGITALLQCETTALERLKSDQMFCQYAEYLY
ncbi:hypothetical protein C2857_000099 [Epichloe festucae Fl1]|uniref:Trichothecene 3-O-acetyltransferase n=1 Tax=Epichloe festucae (strain Fl1) TaxID=877507 RepID=A0A7U3SN34_EPIFF|nr:hypothetical protein C2857_000099 [Epichloe festucae Fl1]